MNMAFIQQLLDILHIWSQISEYAKDCAALLPPTMQTRANEKNVATRLDAAFSTHGGNYSSATDTHSSGNEVPKNAGGRLNLIHLHKTVIAVKELNEQIDQVNTKHVKIIPDQVGHTRGIQAVKCSEGILEQAQF